MSSNNDDAASLAGTGLVNPTADFFANARKVVPFAFMDQKSSGVTDFRPVAVDSGAPEDTDEDPKDSSVLVSAVSLQSETKDQDSDSKPVKVIPASVGKGNILPKV